MDKRALLELCYNILSKIDNKVDIVGYVGYEDDGFVIIVYDGRPAFYKTFGTLQEDLFSLYKILRREHERS